jgi:hypothetical protein
MQAAVEASVPHYAHTPDRFIQLQVGCRMDIRTHTLLSHLEFCARTKNNDER